MSRTGFGDRINGLCSILFINGGPLASAQPPPSCSFARHLVGKMTIFCSFAHQKAQPRG